MYKDKDKQREAQRKWVRQKRAAKGSTEQGSTMDGTQGVTDKGMKSENKRGKDIKCFEDLPPDVQATINRLSESNEEKAKRTAAAIKYQHLFPDRYYSTGVA